MTGSESRLATVCRILNDAKVRYVVVGGFALALHGVVRATQDVDILLESTLPNVRRALRALEKLPYGMAAELDPRDVMQKAITIIGDDPRVDLLTLAWSVRFADAAPRMLVASVQGVAVPYVDAEMLIRSKQTGRLQDQADIVALRQVIGLIRTRPDIG